jgi:glycosyltransferase involved in cell wall biosynthesis
MNVWSAMSAFPPRDMVESEGDPVHVSVVIPMFNEAPNVAAMCTELQTVMNAERLRYEAIIVNDGSGDDTTARLAEAIGDDPRFTVVEFARNFGQSAALAAGFRAARGDVIVAMDGDRQNDPRDIPSLVARLETPTPVDLVSGWRKDRKDAWLHRKLPSACANLLIRRFTSCREIHDFGCTLKAYRREVLDDLRLYGEMHRFLPAIARWRGARVAEVVVNHRPRMSGETKYGLGRTFRVLLDLLTVQFLGGYLTKPIYFFGKLAILTAATTFLALAVAIVQKFGYFTEGGGPVMLNNNIFIVFAVMMFVATLMLVMMGLMSELLIRIYHESQDRLTYRVRHVFRGHAHTPAAGAPTFRDASSAHR